MRCNLISIRERSNSKEKQLKENAVQFAKASAKGSLSEVSDAAKLPSSSFVFRVITTNNKTNSKIRGNAAERTGKQVFSGNNKVMRLARGRACRVVHTTFSLGSF